jgi:lipoprotein-anchoring transpeptidase ErfK/SrfK
MVKRSPTSLSGRPHGTVVQIALVVVFAAACFAVLAIPLSKPAPLPDASLPALRSDVVLPRVAGNQFDAAPATTVLATATAPRNLDDSAGHAAVVQVDRAATRSAPDVGADIVWRAPRTTENGLPMTLLIQKELHVGSTTWYEVLLPIRPNGTRAWINAADAKVSPVRYAIDVFVGEKRLDIARDGQPYRSIPIGVGKDDTPTPGGTFSIMELLRPPTPDTAYGEYVYVLSGYSDVLQTFNGGPGLIGIHGTNEPDSIGREASNGCIRMRNEDITSLIAELPLGTPVRILV